MLYCSFNGVESQQLPVLDHSIHYGDGVFTTATISQGRVVWLSDHIKRLQDACQHFSIEGIDWPSLIAHVEQVAKSFDQHVLKIIISAGQASAGYGRLANCRANFLVMVNAFPMHYFNWQNTGIAVELANTQLGINPVLAGYKHLNRLEQVLLKNEINNLSCDDLLAFNINDELIEAISGNIFVNINEQWCTPSLEESGVNGLARQRLLNHFKYIDVRKIKREELAQVDSMFITNCLLPVVPVNQLASRKLSIDACQPFLHFLKQN